jgi:hypothetical protein
MVRCSLRYEQILRRTTTNLPRRVLADHGEAASARWGQYRLPRVRVSGRRSNDRKSKLSIAPECRHNRGCSVGLLKLRRHRQGKRDGLGVFSGLTGRDDLAAAREQAALCQRPALRKSSAPSTSARESLRSLTNTSAYAAARACSASFTSIFRSSPGPVTRSGKSSRSVTSPACRSMPSGSIEVHCQFPLAAFSNLVA